MGSRVGSRCHTNSRFLIFAPPPLLPRRLSLSLSSLISEMASHAGRGGSGGSGGVAGGGRTENEEPPPPPPTSISKKKKKGGAAATPSLKDCANCGASEGTVPGSPIHKPCSRCKITYYCSVRCQKHHWKVGGHKKHCVAKEERSVAKVEAAEAEAAKAAKERQAAAAAEDGGCNGDGEECVICLEKLDDPQFGPAQTLDCTHRFLCPPTFQWCFWHRTLQ